MEPKRLAYTVEEVARLLGVSVSSVYRAVEAGTLPHKRLAAGHSKGRIIIPAAALERWLNKPDEPRRAVIERKIARLVKGVKHCSAG